MVILVAAMIATISILSAYLLTKETLAQAKKLEEHESA